MNSIYMETPKASTEPDEKIQQKTVVTQAMERIKSLIASGIYKVGDRIPTEQELADRFGSGRSSIREAIKIFQHLGILESRVPKGTFLCDRSHISSEAITWCILLGNDDMWEIIELREVIEERSFDHFIRRCTADKQWMKEVMNRLSSETEVMKTAVETGSIEQLIQADYNFHAEIIKAGNNSLFFAIYRTLHAFMQEEIRKTYQSMKDLMDVYRDHRQMLEVICSGNIEKAIARHQNHFSRIKRLLREEDPSLNENLKA